MWVSGKNPVATASAKAKVARARYRSRRRMVGQGDEGPDAGADHGGGQQAEERAAAGDLAHDEGPDAHEGELAQRDLARVAGEQDQGQADDPEGHHHRRPGVSRVVPLTTVLSNDHGGHARPATKKAAPATSDSLPPATRGGPHGGQPADGPQPDRRAGSTRAMKRNTIGRAR